MYADQKHPDGINAVQAILEDPEMMDEAKEMYKQAYIESALPMITDRIAVDKGTGEGEIDSYIVRAGGFTLPMESENAGERVAGGYIKVGDKGFLSMSGRAFMGVGAGQGLEEVDINTFIQSLDDKELSRLRNTIDLSSVEGVEGLEVDEEGRIQTPPEKFLEAPITQDIAGEMSRELFYKSLGLEVGEVPNDDPVKKAQVEDYEARRQQAQRGKGGLQEPKKQNPVYPK